MRLKYPHIAIGALSASAPVLQFEDIVPPEIFYDIVSNDFRVCLSYSLVFIVPMSYSRYGNYWIVCSASYPIHLPCSARVLAALTP